MVRLKLLWVLLIVLATIAVAFASFRFGRQTQQQMEQNRDEPLSVAYVQATLAFAHHKFYERIESMLVRKCYEAALTEARELKALQLKLLSDNLRRTKNDPQLIEYIKFRDPVVLETVLSGHVPEPQAYTTTCP